MGGLVLRFMATKVKNIIFDLGGVLVGLDMQRCINAFVKLGAGQAMKYAVGHFHDTMFYGYETGQFGEREFCDRLRSEAGISASDEAIKEAWNKMLTVIPDVKKRRLLNLRLHYRVFLLSNTNETHWRYCADHLFPMGGHGVKDYFDRVFLSYELHLSKPDTAIFREALRLADVKTEETLYIDDSVENCDSARSLGMLTFHNAHFNDWIDENNIFE